MKLILSSCDFRNAASREVILKNIPKPLSECKLLFIPNEKASHGAVQGGRYLERLISFGFAEENITVFDHTEAEKYKKLDIDLLYISGGNTFMMLERLRKCGFLSEIERVIRAGVTYIGGSAGAHIVSKDVTHVANFDPLPKKGFTDYSALGLFDGIFVCHYSKEREEIFNSLVEDGKYKVYSLTNEESIVVEN